MLGVGIFLGSGYDEVLSLNARPRLAHLNEHLRVYSLSRLTFRRLLSLWGSFLASRRAARAARAADNRLRDATLRDLCLGYANHLPLATHHLQPATTLPR
jgi:hypothetical protein